MRWALLLLLCLPFATFADAYGPPVVYVQTGASLNISYLTKDPTIKIGLFGDDIISLHYDTSDTEVDALFVGLQPGTAYVTIQSEFDTGVAIVIVTDELLPPPNPDDFETLPSIDEWWIFPIFRYEP